MLNRINLILKAKNITSKQFAEEIGVQPSGLSHILSGRNNPSLDFVMKVIRRYPEIDIHWLMFGKGEMYESRTLQPQVASPADVATTTASTPMPAPGPAPEPDLFSQVISDPQPAPRPEPEKQPQVVSQPVEHPQSVGQPAAQPVPHPDQPVAQPVAQPLDQPVAQPAQSAAQPVAQPAQPVAQPVVQPMAQPAQPVVAENRKNEAPAGPTPEFAVGAKRKKIVKFVVLYDDRTFSEYYPEG